MTLNVAQYLAPLNSGQVLNGYVQGVKQGTGIIIQPDGSITLDPTGASTLGFLTSSTIPAPVYNWNTGTANPQSLLANDGAGNLTWSTDYVQTFPQGQAFPHTGAAAMPAGSIAQRPAPTTPGYLRYNTSNSYLEFSNGSAWLPVSPSSGGVFSFYGPLAPTANFAGDFWYDTTNELEMVWSGTAWVPVTPVATTTRPGRVQAGTNVQVSPAGVISILPTTGVAGGVSNVGVTTVTDNVTSTDVSSALSANQGRLLQDQINALLISNNLTLAGMISGVSQVMTYVTPAGLTQAFAVGSPLPTSTVANEGYFVIVDTAGFITPPGGAITAVTQGDWFLSTGAGWQFLNAGYDPPAATNLQAGIVRLATVAETTTGTDNATATTPLDVRTVAVYKNDYTAKGDILAATANGSPFALAVGTDGQYLKASSVAAPGVVWDTITASDIQASPAINGNTDLQTILQDAVYDIASVDNSITVGFANTGLYNVRVTQATETQLGGAEVATQIEVNSGVSDTVMVTPKKLSGFIAGGGLNASAVGLSPNINGYTNVQDALDNALYSIASNNGSMTYSETPTGIVIGNVTQATETQLGGARIATSAEAGALSADDLIITPAKLGYVFTSGTVNANTIQLSPTINGHSTVQQALTDAVYDITSSDNSITLAETPTGLFDATVTLADETQLGGAEVATQAETNSGIDDDKIVTPLKLAGFVSSGQIEASDIVVNPTINGLSNVQSVLANGIYNIVSANAGITVAEAATGQVTLTLNQATTANIGGATLATTAEALAGTNTTDIITPDTLRAAAVYKSDFNAKGDLLTATGNDAPSILSVGTDGFLLTADSTAANGLKWTAPATAAAITVSPAINGNTTLQTVLQDAIYSVVSANTSLTVAETVTGNITLTAVDSSVAQKGVVELATPAEVVTGTDTVRAVTPDGVRTATVYKTDFNAKGDLLSASANDTPLILPVGASGDVLAVDPTTPTGLKWVTGGFFAAGVRLVFAQAAAPLGWVQDTAVNDRALRVVSGAGGGTGGTSNFSSLFSSSTTINASYTFTSGSTASYQLTVADIPSHTHGLSDPGHVHGVNDPGHNHNYQQRPAGGNQSGTTAGMDNQTSSATTTSTTGISIQGAATGISIASTGGDGGHTHGMAGIGGNMSFTSTNFDLKYLDVIVCTKV